MKNPSEQKFTCPICKKSFLESQTTAFPFCSNRCRQVDLFRWFNEEYSVESFRRDDEDDEADDIPVPFEEIEYGNRIQ